MPKLPSADTPLTLFSPINSERSKKLNQLFEKCHEIKYFHANIEEYKNRLVQLIALYTIYKTKYQNKTSKEIIEALTKTINQIIENIPMFREASPLTEEFLEEIKTILAQGDALYGLMDSSYKLIVNLKNKIYQLRSVQLFGGQKTFEECISILDEIIQQRSVVQVDSDWEVLRAIATLKYRLTEYSLYQYGRSQENNTSQKHTTSFVPQKISFEEKSQLQKKVYTYELSEELSMMLEFFKVYQKNQRHLTESFDNISKAINARADCLIGHFKNTEFEKEKGLNSKNLANCFFKPPILRSFKKPPILKSFEERHTILSRRATV